MIQRRILDEIPVPALLRSARAAYRDATRRAVDAAGFEDLPPNGAYVVGAIARGGSQLSDIISGLAVSKQAGGQLVDTLVLRGYLERSIDPADRRRFTVTLSERGNAAAAAVRSAIAEIDAELRKRVGAESISTARRVLFALSQIAREAGA
jgi:DNA-binding MarR family transcriptional regulator